MDLFAIIILSLLAGWAVNVIADTLPSPRPLGHLLPTAWDWPVRQFFVTATPVAHRHEELAPRRWRTALVWVAALALGWLALGQREINALNLLIALYAWFFLAVAVIDLEHRRVLNVMLLALTPVAVLASLWFQTPSWTSALAGGLLGFLLFLAVALIRPGGMGMGDVKLAGAIGLVTGLSGVLTALTIGILAGGVAALGLLLHSRLAGGVQGTIDRNLSMAYAPYLVLGAWIALYW
ncbi:MAG: A24 family peptidase [Litorilinea sp.]